MISSIFGKLKLNKRHVHLNTIIHSPNPDVDTLRCPSCNEIWYAEGHYDYDEGGWNYGSNGYCPNGCRRYWSGLALKGKLIPRNHSK